MSDLNLKKRLLYRSVHRGCKETDILLGEFAQSELENLSETELRDYETLLEVNDVDIYSWLTQKTMVPTEFDNTVFMKIKKFNSKNEHQ